MCVCVCVSVCVSLCVSVGGEGVSIKSVMPSSHLILCHPLLLPPIPPSIRVFSNESTLHQAKVLEFQLQHQSFH